MNSVGRRNYANLADACDTLWQQILWLVRSRQLLQDALKSVELRRIIAMMQDVFINGAQIRNTYEVTLRNIRQQIDRTIDIARLYILYVLGIHRSAVLLSIFICGRILFTN